MADNEMRLSILLSAVKCSSCGVEIAIFLMGDHVCTSASKGRAPLSRIDASAANKSFLTYDQLTPDSIGSHSPTSPDVGHRLQHPRLMRSTTSPIPRLYTPISPDLPSGYDCAFPPFPRSGSQGSSVARPNAIRRSETDRRRPGAKPDSHFAPLSPRRDGGADVVRRLNTVAPGPFDARRELSGDEASSSGTEGRKFATAVTVTDTVDRAQPPNAGTRSHSQQPSASGSEGSRASVQPGASRAPSGQVNREGRAVPPRPARSETIDAFLEQLQKEKEGIPAARVKPSRIESRSKTFPLRQENMHGSVTPAGALPGRPSESQVRGRRSTQPGSNSTLDSVAIFGPQIPPRGPGRVQQAKIESERELHRLQGATRNTTSIDCGLVNTSPVTATPGGQQYVNSSPCHTPNDSSSSTGSATGLSEPASAVSSVSSCWDVPDEQLRASDMFMQIPRLRVKTDELQGVIFDAEHFQLPGISQQDRRPSLDAPESPMDPAMHGCFVQQLPPSDLPTTSNLPVLPTKESSVEVPAPLQMRHKERETPSPANTRPITAIKGSCRGCGEVIAGKSVKAADGRLTGRYHKQCFVCKTCKEPFATADFYVIDDFPYCERHYHQLNHSLCKTCDRGIEGQYLETQQKQKFHPHCFTCAECHTVLSHDYFEVSNRVYCEEHCTHAAPSGTLFGFGKKDPQRRTTRLVTT
ncbi:hypothetical protein BJ546DRAFT_432986 [Cryomyces antarcticus]